VCRNIPVVSELLRMDGRGPRVKRRGRRIALLAIFLAAASGVVGLGYYRATLHNFPWQGEPARLGWCGFEFDPEGRASADEIWRTWPALRLKAVFRSFPVIGPQVFGLARPGRRSRVACEAYNLFLRISPNRYEDYFMGGGG
jgi:hypothetical protein